MNPATASIVLGSRSPRRRELLGLLVGAERIIVRPPLDPDEPDLSEAGDLDALRIRLSELARDKSDDVVAQLRTDGTLASIAGVLTADTVVVGTDDHDRIAVLGQPPADGNWQQTVGNWFHTYYFGRTHHVLTAVCLTRPDGSRREQVVTTQVSFRDDGARWLQWYLSTEEPLGKAGGYGLQGAGSLFVAGITGSPSNVIGLPLRETGDLLSQAGAM